MTANVALFPVPCDFNSSFARGPAHAPAVIIELLQTGSLNKESELGQAVALTRDIALLPTITELTPDNFFDQLKNAYLRQIKQGRRLLTLGGDHSISYPIVAALFEHYGAMNIVHIDAHSDLYDCFKGNPYSNACPFARIMENGLALSLHQFGIRTLTQHQRDQVKKFNVNCNEMRFGIGELPPLFGPIYLSIDIDGIDPGFAPGVSHPEPGGLTPREVINLIHQLPDNVIGVDIVEYNPDRDVNQQTGYVAAKLAKEALAKLLTSNHFSQQQT